jgi:alpha-mannosidase
VVLYYTFGNHMHWVDMEWLWGYHVLPGSVRDMLRLCREAGVKGCVNFEGIGYEKLAAEDPEVFSDLKSAIQQGTVELVGCSYGQPYGLFHGGESNVRQRVYGVRAAARLFGIRPVTFWEEEFDFFPQLPQILAGVGFTGASLFFQWTWHTPEVPVEEKPVVWWEAPDGSKLLCATRNRLNLHQWPEDMDLTFSELAAQILPQGSEGKIPPLILQWLELMPSPDWMCRSDVILPKLKELLAEKRFEIRACTLGEYLAMPHGERTPTRRYSMSDVWHGMSLGKNGDMMRRLSREAEDTLLSAETAAAIAGLRGRPYPQWDVYPTWELEEAWRELLAAQHHDNDECEGLCGHVGIFSFERSLSLSRHVLGRCLPDPAPRQTEPHYFNPLGWARTVWFSENVSVTVPAFGFAAGPPAEDPGVQVSLDRLPDGIPEPFLSLGRQHDAANVPGVQVTAVPWGEGAVEIMVSGVIERPEPGLNAGLHLHFPLPFSPKIIADYPYGVEQVQPRKKALRKYPRGDWMTSEQWFEEVHNAFTALSFVDLLDAANPDQGVLVAHDGSQQWFLDEEANSVRAVLSMYDPWDEDYFVNKIDARFLVLSHGPMKHSRRWKLAQEFRRPLLATCVAKDAWSAITCDRENVALTAFYRETRDSGKGQQTHACDVLGVDYPYVLRLVELDGEQGEVELAVSGAVAGWVWTNLLGEPQSNLQRGGSRLRIALRPYEIATIYLDIEEGRKQVRDLDAKREVWATIHRTGEDGAP